MGIYEIVRGIGCLTLPYIGGSLGGSITTKNMDWYKSLKKPYFSPPPWVFGPAWAFLYGSMGLASLYIVNAGDAGADVTLPLLVYGIQLLLNWSWTPVYFGLKKFKTVSIFSLKLNENLSLLFILVHCYHSCNNNWCRGKYLSLLSHQQ